jgi:hypothetical protein
MYHVVRQVEPIVIILVPLTTPTRVCLMRPALLLSELLLFFLDRPAHYRPSAQYCSISMVR